MTTAGQPDRSRLVAAVADAADAVVTILAAHPVHGIEPYPIAAVLPSLVEQHRILQEAVDGYPGEPVDTAGRPDPLVADLAGLMSYLQLVRVLYHGLDAIPPPLRIDAGRNISALHAAARRVRDRARRAMG